MQTQLYEARSERQDGDAAATGWSGPAAWLVGATALLLGVVLLYQGLQKGYFGGVTEVDDAVYYGEGVMLTHGILPYHSYIDVQTPGIALLMAPFAALGRLTSDRVGFEAARAFMVLVAVANVGLLGRLLRRRHWIGVLTGVTVLAFYEDSLIADHTVLLEPLLVLTALVAFLLVFDDVEIATSSSARWLGAGALLGVCTSLKVWGLLPFVVLAYFANRQSLRCLGRFVIGGGAAFVIISGPFFFSSPSAFWHQVVVVQATRAHIERNPFHRLGSLLGVTGHVGIAVAIWLLLGLCVVGSLVLARRTEGSWGVTELDAAAIACVVIIGIAFLLSPEFDPHYGGFFAPFLALVLSATAVRLLPLGHTVVPVLITVAVVLFVGHSVKNVVDQPRVSTSTAALDRVFAPNACVLSTDYGPEILGDRYNLYQSGCPRIVDTFGTELTVGGGYADVPTDARMPRLQSDWANWLRNADGLVLNAPLAEYPDLNASVKEEIRSNFRLVDRSDGDYIYRRTTPR
jgi:hypothetical protein